MTNLRTSTPPCPDVHNPFYQGLGLAGLFERAMGLNGLMLREHGS